MLDSFNITMRFWRGGKYNNVKFYVDLYHSSSQVERYRLTAGAKVMEVERRVMEKKNKQWRLLSRNFEFKILDETTIANLHEVYRLIDEHRLGVQEVPHTNKRAGTI